MQWRIQDFWKGGAPVWIRGAPVWIGGGAPGQMAQPSMALCTEIKKIGSACLKWGGGGTTCAPPGSTTVYVHIKLKKSHYFMNKFLLVLC